ncbi:Membrane protein involved in the export of O-antigen and teichoic acid [Clostridium cadaveris]|uniref:Membrane protein involved in the export of O-antigen and teichoic acid n=1 Tax=Clostridium cadaveris TaxID=1529 RepID=A0A1I2N616_9CLOT|nr:oligosaccharide flippase family protein [Clostridium cadaveris]MDM8313010.1 oligosaccharide flippase family protein [Clostridium cadaveris]SFF99053.1 Membrane protein involved in the export of O-antigen and teichoic acid [Clostridium cadaveris]
MGKMSKNMISSIVSQLVTIVTGFLVQRYVLISYGSELNGLISFVTQILAYLVLIEAGITTASIQALYKPISKKNIREINGILSATKRKFIKVGCIFFLILGISALIFPLIIGNQVSYGTVCAVTIVSGASTGISYLYINKYQALLYADDKTGVVYNISSISVILICILKICLMKMGTNLVCVQAVQIIGVICKILILSVYVNKRYREVSFDENPNNEAINKSKNVFIHQMAGFVNNHTDVILISTFSTLKNVSLYSVYNLIYSHLNSLMQSAFAQAPMGFFGKKYVSNYKDFRKIYDIYELIYTGILFVILTAALIMTMPFIHLYTKGVTDMQYSDGVLAWLFFTAQFFNLIRVPSVLTINVSGTFKETQKGAIWEAIINLGISIPLFFFIGIKGLLIGTIAAMLFRSYDVTVFTYNNIIGKKILEFYKLLVVHLIPSITLAIISQRYLGYIIINWAVWFGVSCIVVVMLLTVEIILIRIFYSHKYHDTISYMKNFVRGKKK